MSANDRAALEIGRLFMRAHTAEARAEALAEKLAEAEAKLKEKKEEDDVRS